MVIIIFFIKIYSANITISTSKNISETPFLFNSLLIRLKEVAPILETYNQDV